MQSPQFEHLSEEAAMTAVPEEVANRFYSMVRARQRKRCEDIVLQHYPFVEDLDPYEIAPDFPATIDLFTENGLQNARRMIAHLEFDFPALQGQLGVQPDDVLAEAEVLDHYCSIFDLQFSSGARVVYKGIPAKPYELWEFAAEKAGIFPMKTLCREDHLYCAYVERRPLSENQSPHTYYERLGRLLAVSHVFGSGDLHTGNLYPIGDTPVVIDCDMLFHIGKPYWRIAASGCLPYDDGEGLVRPAEKSPFYCDSVCPFECDGRVYYFEDYADDIKQGYEQCAMHVLPEIRNDFLERAQGARYRYLPMKDTLASTLFKQRVVFGYREPTSSIPIIKKIMESINQLKQPKFYAEIGGDVLYYGDTPIDTVEAIAMDLLEYRFDAVPTRADIAIQFEDIDNAAKMLRSARKRNEPDGTWSATPIIPHSL